MGYAPKYDYTAWKNGREKESNQGFKGVVFKSGDVFVYYNVHAQTSSLRRVYEPHHTITLAIVDARTNETLLEINHKGDFGFLAARAEPSGFIPLSAEDAKLMVEQNEDQLPPRRRTVNVINLENLDRRFSYLPKDRVLLGKYEGWTTSPLCTGGGMYDGGITVDITAPSTGIKSVFQKDAKVLLGHYKDGQFIRSTGARRVLQVKNFKIGEDLCMLKLENIHGKRSASGFFYTDAFGKNLMAGPGRGNVRQYIKPGLKMSLTGTYETIDSWLGLHKKDHIGFVKNYGYGVNGDIN